MLLLDANIPKPIAEALKLLNVEVTHLSEHLPGNASDDQVVEKARELGAIVVTQDMDFASRKPLFLDMAAKGVSVAVIRPPRGAKMDEICEIILYYRQRFYDYREQQGPSVILVKRPSIKARSIGSLPIQQIEG